MSENNDNQERKRRTEVLLKKQGIPYIAHLPALDSEAETSLRTLEEVCDRAICLALVAAYAEGLEKDILLEKAQEFGVLESFSPEEKDFIAMENFDDNLKAKFLWRYEALWVLLWSLGYVEELGLPLGICDVSFAVGAVVSRGRKKFLQEGRLRSKAEILDQADLIFRIHWATTDARIKGQPMPAALNNDTVYERHYTLNWLIKDQDAPWDEVGTNT